MILGLRFKSCWDSTYAVSGRHKELRSSSAVSSIPPAVDPTQPLVAHMLSASPQQHLQPAIPEASARRSTTSGTALAATCCISPWRCGEPVQFSVNSTRRFLARPSSVSFVSIGE